MRTARLVWTDRRDAARTDTATDAAAARAGLDHRQSSPSTEDGHAAAHVGRPAAITSPLRPTYLGPETAAQMARMFGVSPPTVSRIVAAHVTTGAHSVALQRQHQSKNAGTQ